MDDRPIGMFDSGFGGLTVARAVIDLLPSEHLVYIGDTGRYPYGPRDLDEVRAFAHQITAKLVKEHDAKLVVVACNTAAAAALSALQEDFDVPVVSVVEPGLRAAVRATETGRVGVIGTVGTIASGAYQRALAAIEPSGRVDLTCAACPGFVEFVERGETKSDQVYVLSERLLAPVRAAKVDTLLLGCTHYPFLARTISDVVGREVVLVSSADETAFELRALLDGDDLARGIAAPGSHTWISSGDTATFRRLGRRLLGPEIERVEAWGPQGVSSDEALSVTVLGCDGTFPGPGGASSGYLVRAGGTCVWLDAGSGTLANLQRYVSIDDLDAVVISHQHVDHWSDLEHLAIACKWVIGREHVAVYAPDGFSELTRVGTASEVLDWQPIGDGARARVGALSLLFCQTDHPVTTYAVRVDHGDRSFGYSADSGPAWGLASLGAGLNLALCEATFLSDKEGTLQHMSARQAGESARSAGVERLVITHLQPGVEREAARREAEAAFGASVAVAAIGDRYQV